jgi:hypothetical protein
MSDRFRAAFPPLLILALLPSVEEIAPRAQSSSYSAVSIQLLEPGDGAFLCLPRGWNAITTAACTNARAFPR